MEKTFTYTILQYKHSLLLNETVNIGILFEFPQDDIIRFVEGDLTRLKAIYNNFDTPTTNKVLKAIQNKSIEISKEQGHLFQSNNVDELHKRLLREDDSSLQFSKPKTISYPFDNLETIVEQYNSLFLPIGNTSRANRRTHNEYYILRNYTHFLFQNRKELEIVASKHRTIQTKDVTLTFDLSWENGTDNLVKPLSFDYQDGQEIQNKSVTFFGYLTKLKEYAVSHNVRYDLLVTRPQNEELLGKYETALKIVNSADAPKRIITEDQLEAYSEETAHYLKIKFDKLKEAL